MAENTQKSLLLQKLGNAFLKAHEEAKNVDAATGGGNLPAGIDGIAQLVDCRIMEVAAGKQNAGKLQFYAAGVVVLPKTGKDGLPIAGRRTMIIEPIYDTPTRTRKTVNEHIKWIYAQLKSLGLTNLQTIPPDKVDAAIEALKKSQPYFAFHTFKGPTATTGIHAGKEPMITHMWDGRVNFKPTEKPKPDVTVNFPQEQPPSAEEHPEATEQPSQGNGDDIDPAMVDGSDIDSLLEKAKTGDLVAQKSLSDQAEAMGIPPDVIGATNTWEELVDLIRVAGTTTPTDEPQEQAIDVGDKFNFKPLDKKSGKKVEKPIQVEVTAVNADTNSVDLKNLKFPAIVYKNVPVDELEDVA